MKVAKDFVLQEFVHPELYRIFGNQAIRFVDERLITIAQFVRDVIDCPIDVNTYVYGGNYIDRGVRLPESRIGAKFSMHKLGKAIDISSRFMGIEEIYNLIRKYDKDLFDMGLRRIEDIIYTPTWLHLDVANTRHHSIQIIAPKLTRSVSDYFKSEYEKNDI
jgi:hypothetical protein